MKMRSTVVAVFAVWSSLSVCQGEGAVSLLDLTKHNPADKANIRTLEKGVYEWSLPDGLSQTLSFDLEKLGINPKDYDEFRFEIKPEGSLVGLHTALQGFPDKKDLSSWYLKFKTVEGQWSEGRYDLRVDDDGIFGGKSSESAGRFGLMTLSLDRRVIGFPGEPKWRKAQIRMPRFVKYWLTATFDPLETAIQDGAEEIAYVYQLHLENRTDKVLTAKIDPDSDRTLKYFQISAPGEVTLAAREKKSVPIRISISRQKAMALPPLFAEHAFPNVYMEGVPDSDVIPLMGFRRWPMWGTVPIFNRVWWTPVAMQAHVDARKTLFPGVDAWKAKITNCAEMAMNVNWPTPPLDLLPPGYDQGYICKDCKCSLTPAEPASFTKHVCPRCKKSYENDYAISKSFIPNYLGARFEDIRALALSYQLTGREDYAKKAVQMLLSYADAYPSFPVTGMRSTSGGSRFGRATLFGSYLLPILAEAYTFLHEAPCLDGNSRLRIERMLNEEAGRLARHSTEYSNQTMEHLRAYGSVGLATGCWPLAAEAIQGEFGWHEMAEYAFSEDGITGEAGAYHWSIFVALNRFAGFASSQGINLLTARLKRVYDGTLTLLPSGKYPGYELAYRVYRDPAYINALSGSASEEKIFCGAVGIPNPELTPVKSVLMPAAGYVFLRSGNAADSREIRLNYIKTFDRLEFDRFSTFFYHNGMPVDASVGRIKYTVEGGRMEATAAHNAIVIDGLDEKPVDGDLLSFHAAENSSVAAVVTDPASPFFEGVSQLRGVALLDTCYIVFDRITADRPRTIDRFQYGQGKALLKFSSRKTESPIQNPPPIGTFKDVEGGACGKEARIDFGNNLKMRLVSDKDFDVYKAVTAGTYEARPMDVTFARISNATEATFLAGFTDEKDVEPPVLRIRSSTPEKLVLEVEMTGKTQVITVDIQTKNAAVSELKR